MHHGPAKWIAVPELQVRPIRHRMTPDIQTTSRRSAPNSGPASRHVDPPLLGAAAIACPNDGSTRIGCPRRCQTFSVYVSNRTSGAQTPHLSAVRSVWTAVPHPDWSTVGRISALEIHTPSLHGFDDAISGSRTDERRDAKMRRNHSIARRTGRRIVWEYPLQIPASRSRQARVVVQKLQCPIPMRVRNNLESIQLRRIQIYIITITHPVLDIGDGIDAQVQTPASDSSARIEEPSLIGKIVAGPQHRRSHARSRSPGELVKTVRANQGERNLHPSACRVERLFGLTELLQLARGVCIVVGINRTSAKDKNHQRCHAHHRSNKF